VLWPAEPAKRRDDRNAPDHLGHVLPQAGFRRPVRFRIGRRFRAAALALAAENTAGARIVQLASAEAFTDGGDALDAGDNLAFFTACVGWLSGEQVAAAAQTSRCCPTMPLFCG
jgi:hypothetical protein